MRLSNALPRDALSSRSYHFTVQKPLLLSLLIFSVAAFGAESIELQDGTKVEGKILSVTADTVLMEVQTSPTIREEKSYPRTDVAKIQRASQDDIAFEEIAAISAPATADDPAAYDGLIEAVRTFTKNYAYSKHMPEARKLAATLESERSRLSAGEIKVDDQWSAAAASPADRIEQGGNLQLSKMKTASDPTAALAAFEVLEKNHGKSSAYPEAVKSALASIEKLRANLLLVRSDLDRRISEQKQGLQLASEDRRLQMEAGIAQEKAAVQAQIDRAKQNGAKWIPLLPDPKVLDDLSKLADTEDARLSKIDVQTLSEGVVAVSEAKAKLEAGDLDGAKISLDDAQKLWSQHVLLASLRESLKKAEKEDSDKAKEESKPAAP